MIFPGDTIIAEAIRRGMEDMKKQPWLIDDVFSSFVQIPELKEKYGQKEIDNAKTWFQQNKIDVVMRYRADKEEMPCVTIALGNSGEKDEMKHLDELSTEVETLMPSQVGKPINYIVKPFTPSSIDEATLTVTVPSEVSLRIVRSGMVLVDVDTGNGYIIEDVQKNEIYLADLQEGQSFSGKKFAVIPQFPFYRVRRKHTFFQESYMIGCHVHGDTAPLLWLHAIVLYCLLRYRESLLERNGFAESSLASTDIVLNQDFSTSGADKVFSRYITLTGQVEQSWLAAPQRVIEAVETTEETDEGIKTGIKICSNLNSPDFLDTEDESWTTIDQDE